MTYLAVNTVGEVPEHLLAARVNNGIRRAAFERRTRGTMEEEQGKKLDPNDPAIPAKPDKPTALADEDLDKVAGGHEFTKIEIANSELGNSLTHTSGAVNYKN
jgi:hypothetical protein